MTKSDIREVSDIPLYNIADLQNLDYALIEHDGYKCIIARRWSSIRKMPKTKKLDYTFVTGRVTKEDLMENGDYRLLVFSIFLDDKYNIRHLDKYIFQPIVYNHNNAIDNIRLLKKDMEYTGNHPVLQMVLNKAKTYIQELKI